MKRIISVLLALAMLLAGSTMAFAEEQGTPFAVVEFNGGTVGSYPEGGLLLIQKDEDISVLGTEFQNPTGLAVDDDGNLYVSETDNGRIIKITTGSAVSEYKTGLQEPMGLCWTNGKLYVAETGKNRIVCISGGAVTVVAGKEIKDGDDEYKGAHVNGTIEETEFDHPQGVCVLEDGTVFVSDTNNHSIRMLKNDKSYTVIYNGDMEKLPVTPGHMWVEDGILNIKDRLTNSVATYDVAGKKFSDVKDSDWFADFIEEGVLMGLIGGVDETHFDPASNVTRSQFACMIARAALYKNGSLVIGGDSSFEDVAEKTWYTDEVKWAADKTVVQGYEGKFYPNDNVTRQDLITMLYRYAKAENLAPEALASLHGYAGLDDLAAYAEDAMSWAISAGIIDGRPAEVDEEKEIYFGDLAPKGTATRAEAVKILVAFLNKPY